MMINKSNINVERANTVFALEFPKSSRFITTRLGYKLEVKDEYGNWLKNINYPDDNGTVTKINTTDFFTGQEEIDQIISSLFQHLLSNYLGKTIMQYSKGIGLVTSEIYQGKDLESSFYTAISQVKSDSDLTAIKLLSNWLIMNELRGYKYDFHAELCKLSRGGNKNSYATLFTFDGEFGPFVSEEMEILQAATANPNIHLEDRVILLLLIFFGLRPIQISLLKQSDLIKNKDTGLYLLKIPRVKQNQQKRRKQFTKRLLNDELADSIKKLIDIHREVNRDLFLEDPPLIMRRYKTFVGKNHPYRLTSSTDYFYNSESEEIARTQAYQPYQSVYDDSYKTDEGHHLSSLGIAYRLQSIAKYLPNSPRTQRQFNLFPYRFRYTLGTNAVMEGKTEAEVMDLLDHSSPGSVKHYFRYTHEMYEILNEATNKRVEQQHFVAAWTREGEQTGNIYGQEIVEIKYFTSIGKCHKGSFCSFEPAVACYNCDKFCPSKDAKAHENALETLNDRLEELKATSTGAVLHQLDVAIAGCKAAIAYSEGKDIEFLEFHTEDRGLDDE